MTRYPRPRVMGELIRTRATSRRTAVPASYSLYSNKNSKSLIPNEPWWLRRVDRTSRAARTGSVPACRAPDRARHPGLPRFAEGYLGWGSDAHPGGLAGGRGPGRDADLGQHRGDVVVHGPLR